MRALRHAAEDEEAAVEEADVEARRDEERAALASWRRKGAENMARRWWWCEDKKEGTQRNVDSGHRTAYARDGDNTSPQNTVSGRQNMYPIRSGDSESPSADIAESTKDG